jgi:hypothetical protein
VKGHNPDLILFDNNGKETDRIDLTKYDKRGDVPRDEYVDGLHALLKEKGFTRKRGSNQFLNFAKGHFRFVRFTTVKTRAEGSMVQVAAFQFSNEGIAVRPVSCRNPGGDSPQGEGPEFLLQTSLRTKWIDKNVKPVIFDFGKPATLDGFRWATGFDPRGLGRDPVRWKLEATNQLGGTWTMLHDTSEADYPVHEHRSKWIVGNLPAETHGEL